MLRVPGIFKEVSIIAHRDLKKDQIYESWGTLWSVSAVTVCITRLKFKPNHIHCRFTRHAHLKMLTAEGVAVINKNHHRYSDWRPIDIDAQVRILQCVKNFLGCCLNHCTTVFCMLFSDMNIQPEACI
jgi:hypothetical protein